MKQKQLLTISACSLLLGTNVFGAPELNLDLSQITVSGLSSGGYMANQFHIAHSEWVNGAAILAAGPYYCAQGDINKALAQCINKVEPELNLDVLNRQLLNFLSTGVIDDISHLENDKVWLFHGKRDQRIHPDVATGLFEQYTQLVDSDNIAWSNDKPIAHVFPTQNKGGECMTSESPFIGRCEFDAAGAFLTHLYGSLNPPAETVSGKVYPINQKTVAGANADTMAEEGFVYVPQTCDTSTDTSSPCRVHVSFHGCNQFAEAIGMDYVEKTGLNEWADTNNIVILYPQTKQSLFLPINPQGCWDWWGYTGADYATQNGAQIQAVTTMIKSLGNK